MPRTVSRSILKYGLHLLPLALLGVEIVFLVDCAPCFGLEVPSQTNQFIILNDLLSRRFN